MIRTLPIVAAALWPLQSAAETLQIVTDIAPVHSLVAQVSAGITAPSVLVSGGASPHNFQFTFDQAGTLQDADVVIWVGPALTPWLSGAVDTMAADATQLTLLDTAGWTPLDRREDIAFDIHDDHDHGSDHDDHDDHGHDDHDHDDDGHDDHDDHDDHGHDDHDDHDDQAEDDGHVHIGDTDPHAWLDPMIASAWVDQIADTLATADPENAGTYRANAVTTKAGLEALAQDITTRLGAVASAPYLVPHDAYQYFEVRFDLPAAGAISLSDAAAPSPDQIEALQTMVRADGIKCVLNDPQSRTTWVDLVREGSDANTALADPMGGAFATGLDHYNATLLAITDAYVDCLGD